MSQKKISSLALLLCVTAWLTATIRFDALAWDNRAEPPQLGMTYVKKFVFTGNSIFSDKELSEIAAPFENRNIHLIELEELRRKITSRYIDSGYINSGAVIPEQEVAHGGTIKIIIMEGKITDVEVSGNKTLKTKYVESRLQSAIGGGKILNIKELENRLKLLKQDSLIENIDATILPGLRLGEAGLKLKIDEAKTYAFGIGCNNHVSPSIGALQAESSLSLLNVTGWGDALTVKYGKTKGYDNYSVNYSIPVTRRDAKLSFDYSKHAITIVSYPFSMLDIRSETEALSVSLRQPVYKTLSQELAFGVELEKLHNETFLLDIPFSFSEHSEDYETDTSVLTFSGEWFLRGMKQVLALRSDLRIGTDWFGATTHKGEYADSDYLSLLTQVQLFKKLTFLNSALLLKSNFQLSDDPIPHGKFPIGGATTVRGYRENLITTDCGLLASVEWRIPLLHLRISKAGSDRSDGLLEIAPFFDYGKGWNIKASPEPDEIYSTGAGLRWQITKGGYAHVYYGYGLRKVQDQTEYDLQDDGVHFKIVFEH